MSCRAQAELWLVAHAALLRVKHPFRGGVGLGRYTKVHVRICFSVCYHWPAGCSKKGRAPRMHRHRGSGHAPLLWTEAAWLQARQALAQSWHHPRGQGCPAGRGAARGSSSKGER